MPAMNESLSKGVSPTFVLRTSLIDFCVMRIKTEVMRRDFVLISVVYENIE